MTNRKDGEYDLLTSSLVMTIPRINILTTPAAAKGSIAYDLNSNAIFYSNGSTWVSISASGNDLLGYSFTNPGYPTLPPDEGIPIFDSFIQQWTVSPITGDIGMEPSGDYIISAIDGNPVGPFSFLTAGDVMSWNGSSWVNATGGGSPTGPAGGSLAGTYPNPTLATTGVVAGAYTTTNLTVNSSGQITSISNGATSFPPSGVAGGDLTGTYPNPTLTTTTVTPGSYGSATEVGTFTVDTKGRVTTAANTTISGVAPGGPAGGVLAGTYPNPDFAQGLLTATKAQFGFTTTAVDTSVAYGAGAVANQAESVTVGQDAYSDGWRSVLVGCNSYIDTGCDRSVMVGQDNNCFSINATGIGYGISVSTSTNATVAGRAASASGSNNGTAYGTGAGCSSSADASVFGPNATATNAAGAVVAGSGASATAAGAVGLGQNITANQINGFFVRHRNDVAPFDGQVGIFNVGTNELSGMPYPAGSNYVLTSDAGGIVAWSATAPAGGSAGGDLTGTYPNPTLTTTAVTPGSYGSATQVGTFTVDSKGRLTAAGNTTISGTAPGGSAGGDLTGTYPNPTLATTAVTPASYGSATQVGTFTVDSKGRLTAAANTTITGVTPGGSAGGDLTGTYPNPTLTTTGVSAETYEHMTATVDTKGRITSASRRETTVAMTLAEFTGLNGTPKEILPAPGAGYYYLIHDWSVSRTHGSAVLVLGSDVTLTYGNAAIAATAFNMAGASFTGTSNHIFVAGGWTTASNAVRTDMENKAINIRVTGASFTGGTGSSFQVSVFYSIRAV